MPARQFLSWRNTGLFGVWLVAIGTAYFFFDEVTADRYGTNILEVFGIIGMVGVLLALIGLIGWARQLGKHQRLQMAAWVFFAPWIAVFSGYLVDDLNIHGSAGLALALMFLSIILTIILLVMAAIAKQN
jgi:hypothetical protein